MKKVTISVLLIGSLSFLFIISAAACSPKQNPEDIEALLAKQTLTLEEQQTVASALF